MTYTVAEWSDVSVPAAGRITADEAATFIPSASAPDTATFLVPDKAAL